MGKKLGILDEIIKAQPIDGLWDDGRTDVSQLGMSYQELEDAMKDSKNKMTQKIFRNKKKEFAQNETYSNLQNER